MVNAEGDRRFAAVIGDNFAALVCVARALHEQHIERTCM